MDRKEFCRRFVARMVEIAGPADDDGLRYAQQAAEAAYDDLDQREEGPEACAETDVSYWEA